MKQSNKQKLYCYIDETGQDVGSDFFYNKKPFSKKKDIMQEFWLSREARQSLPKGQAFAKTL